LDLQRQRQRKLLLRHHTGNLHHPFVQLNQSNKYLPTRVCFTSLLTVMLGTSANKVYTHMVM
jgi:hypothetical protein